MAKGEPFSIRLSSTTDRAVDAEARRTRRSKGAIVEALAEEAMRMRRFPGIAFRGDDARRRPWLIGTGLDLWEIIHMLEDYRSIDRLARESHLTERQVKLALAYQEAYPSEIAEAIAESRRSAEELRELYPFVEVAQPRR